MVNGSKRPRSSEGGNFPPASNRHDPRWSGRCFKCFEFGHDKANCPSKSTICSKCNEPGHDARMCRKPSKVSDRAAAEKKKKTLENLQPRGFFDEKEFPENRPELFDVFVPQGPEQIRDIQKLSSAVVIDTRLKLTQGVDSIQAAIMAACNSDEPLPLIHMADERYLLILPRGADRGGFLQKFGPKLEEVGYVAYPWNAAVDA